MNHVGMAFFYRWTDGDLGVKANTNTVRVFRLSQITDGKGMVFGSQFQLPASLCTVNVEFVVLGAFHLNLAFHIVGIVDVERQHPHRA